MSVLRDHRPQDRHQLRRTHVLHIEHLRHDLIRGAAHVIGQVDRGELARIGIGQDLDHVARRHRDEAVHLQDRQERLVEGRRRHRGRREHRHLGAHPRVDDEVLARGCRHRLRDLRDVRVLEVRRDALHLRRRQWRLLWLSARRCGGCAEASEAVISTASAHTANERKPLTDVLPRMTLRPGYWLPPLSSGGTPCCCCCCGGSAAPAAPLPPACSWAATPSAS